MSESGYVVAERTTENDADTHAFFWTPKDGMIDLEDYSTANAVSASGQPSERLRPMGRAHAFSWTKQGSMADLGTLGGFPARRRERTHTAGSSASACSRATRRTRLYLDEEGRDGRSRNFGGTWSFAFAVMTAGV